MAEACRRCTISGRVQGVGFRAASRQQGHALGLTVTARNLSDGRVEVVAGGPEEALDAFCEWLHRGPRFSRVVDVRCEAIAPSHCPESDPRPS